MFLEEVNYCWVLNHPLICAINVRLYCLLHWSVRLSNLFASNCVSFWSIVQLATLITRRPKGHTLFLEPNLPSNLKDKKVLVVYCANVPLKSCVCWFHVKRCYIVHDTVINDTTTLVFGLLYWTAQSHFNFKRNHFVQWSMKLLPRNLRRVVLSNHFNSAIRSCAYNGHSN